MAWCCDIEPRAVPMDCPPVKVYSFPAASGSPMLTICRGRSAKANALLDRLLGLRNDVGLLSEEYDPVGRRQVGNFPQAFSHMALVRTILVQEGKMPLADQVALYARS
jgi:hypothetical protein